MSRTAAALLAAIISAAALGGCAQQVPGTTRQLGCVDYTTAFNAARDVMSQYFSVESADESTGVIKSRPKSIDAENDRLLGSSPAQQVATLRITRQSGGQVAARASVLVQRQVSDNFRGTDQTAVAHTEQNYQGVPNQTPAELEGATTPQQNQTWQSQRYDHGLERTMLDQIYRCLSPQPTSQPITQPAR